MDRGSQEPQRFAVHSDDIRESFKLAFESVKHLTTLSASTLAVFATFLDRIFPDELHPEVQRLVGLSFAFFIVSLVFSAFSLQRIAGLMRSRRRYGRKKQKIRWNILLPSLFYIFGLSLFGAAVLLDVFFGAQDFRAEADEDRIHIYGGLVVLIVLVLGWVVYRIRIGNLRDKEGEYEVMYPGVRDYDELVARERTGEAFGRLSEDIHDEGRPKDERGAQQQQGDGYGEQSSSDMRHQAYADLLALTHPHKLVVIGKQIPVNFLEFRDTVDALEAQMMLLSPPEVQQASANLVDRFIDCVTAREKLLRRDRVDEEKQLEPKLTRQLRTWLAKYFPTTKDQGEESASRKKLQCEFDKKRVKLSEARSEFVKATRRTLNGSKKRKPNRR
jgi:hypothetical protein